MAEEAAGFAGQPDGYERLWTPHRMVYVDGGARPKGEGRGDCPFCAAPAKPDAEALIVARGEHVYAVLNLFPYNPGHVLVCPYGHLAQLTELGPEASAELIAFSQLAIRALTATRRPQGFNLGMNLGSVAGAGIAAHLHLHVVPRWTGDSNFFPLIAKSRALPELLSETRAALAAAWAEA
jgi:ATP adenylyltransferase